jgi:hypothetical protein
MRANRSFIPGVAKNNPEPRGKHTVSPRFWIALRASGTAMV